MRARVRARVRVCARAWFMWDMTGSAKARRGSGAAAEYSAGVTVPARAKPPTKDTSSMVSILHDVIQSHVIIYIYIYIYIYTDGAGPREAASKGHLVDGGAGTMLH